MKSVTVVNHFTETAISSMLFQSRDLLALIFSFQDGIYEDLCHRFQERFWTIPYESWRDIEHVLPSNFRSIKCRKENFINLNQLALEGTYRDRRFPLHIAIADGEINIVRKIRNCRPELLTIAALRCALNFQQHDIILYILSIVDWDLNKDITSNETLMDVAIERNNLSVIRVLQQRGETLCDIHKALYCGKLATLECLHELGYRPKAYDDVDFKFTTVPLEVLSFFATQLAPQHIQSVRAFYDAGRSGRMDIVQFVIEYWPTENKELIFEGAAFSGQLQILQWLDAEYGVRGQLNFLPRLIASGRYPILNWFVVVHEWKYQVSNIELAAALEDMAIVVTDIRFVKLIHSLGLPLDIIHPKSIEVAKYLHREGIVFTFQHIEYAIGVWCRVDGDETEPQPNFEVVKFIHESQPTAPFHFFNMDAAAENGSLCIVQYLHEQRTEGCSDRAMDMAIWNGHIEIVRYLHLFRSEFCSLYSLSTAMSNGHFEIVKYLLTSIDPSIWVVEEFTLQNMCINPSIIEYILDHCNYDNQLALNLIFFGRVDFFERLIHRNSLTSVIVDKVLRRMIQYGAVNTFPCVWAYTSTLWKPNKRKKLAKDLLRLINAQLEFNGPWTQIIVMLLNYIKM